MLATAAAEVSNDAAAIIKLPSLINCPNPTSSIRTIAMADGANAIIIVSIATYLADNELPLSGTTFSNIVFNKLIKFTPSFVS